MSSFKLKHIVTGKVLLEAVETDKNETNSQQADDETV
jgi:hypothetical protein